MILSHVYMYVTVLSLRVFIMMTYLIYGYSQHACMHTSDSRLSYVALFFIILLYISFFSFYLVNLRYQHAKLVASDRVVRKQGALRFTCSFSPQIIVRFRLVRMFWRIFRM
jgi:hypothetical protein